jgi:hypothetical protein
MLLTLVLLIIFTIFTFVISNFRISELTENIDLLEDKVNQLNLTLNSLEKDAIKIRFTGTPNHIIHPNVGSIVVKSNPKQFDGIKSEEPFVKTRKRKPKSVKDWEDNFDLGGHE